MFEFSFRRLGWFYVEEDGKLSLSKGRYSGMRLEDIAEFDPAYLRGLIENLDIQDEKDIEAVNDVLAR